MSIYTIGDLHLSFGTNKPMDIFGEVWEEHANKIKEDWIRKVKNDDVVLLLGDFSWAMNLKDTYDDFNYLNQLPGKKILLKGNHDYWWTTLKSMRKYLDENNFKNIDFLYNNSFCYEEYIIAGTRGWSLLESKDNNKILRRENLRLELSINDGLKKYGQDKKIIVATHYPPITKHESDTEFLQIMKKYNVERCYYGHLHGVSHQEAICGDVNGIEMQLVSCDYTNFKLIKVR